MRLLQFLLFLPVSVLAQTMEPGTWFGVAPDHAMGQFSAMYYGPNDAQVTMMCAGWGMRLSIILAGGVGPEPGEPADLVANPRFLYVDGRYYPTAGPQESYNAVWSALQSQPFPGQETLLQATGAGADIIVAIAPGGDLGKPMAVGTIPGRQNDPGYAPVVADCGSGPPVQGPVETRPVLENAPIHRTWTLRERGERYPFPVAMAYLLGPDGSVTGDTLGLYCDGENVPAAYVFGYSPPRDGQTITVTTVTLDIGSQVFKVPAVPYGTDHLFRVSQTMTDAMGRGATIRFHDSAGNASRVDTNGGAAALSHVYGRCGLAQDF